MQSNKTPVAIMVSIFLKLILSKCLLMAQMCPTWGTFVLFKEQFYRKGK